MIDPKKALALRDGEDNEEGGRAPFMLVELASSEGTTPDRLAGELQRVEIRYELALLLPLFVLPLGQSLFGWHSYVGWTMVPLYVFTAWPVLGLSLVWKSLRGRHRRTYLADRAYLAAAFYQAFGVAVLTTALSIGLAAPLLGLRRGWVHTGVMVAGVLGGIVAGYRSLASSLVERELESLASAEVPSQVDLAESRGRMTVGAAGRSLAGTLFRAAAFVLVGYAPYILLNLFEVSPPSRGPLAALHIAWIIMNTGLGFQHLMRGVFYQAMAWSTLEALEDRRARLERQASEDVPVVVPETPLERSWRELRTPQGIARTLGAAGILGSLFAAVNAAFPGDNWSLAVLPWIGVYGALLPNPYGLLDSSLGRRLRASFLALIPAAASLCAGAALVMLLFEAVVGPFHYAASLALGVSLTFLVERSLALWAWAATRALGNSPGGLNLREQWNESLTVIRRSGAAALGTMAVATALARVLAAMLGMSRLGVEFGTISLGLAVAVTVAVQSHWAAASGGAHDASLALGEAEPPPEAKALHEVST